MTWTPNGGPTSGRSTIGATQRAAARSAPSTCGSARRPAAVAVAGRHHRRLRRWHGLAVAGAASVADDPAILTFTADFGQGAQTITLNLGAFGAARGLTQFAAHQYIGAQPDAGRRAARLLSRSAIRENGDVAVNYDNGQSRVIARVPITTFNAPGHAAAPRRPGLHAHRRKRRGADLRRRLERRRQLAIGSVEGPTSTSPRNSRS